MSFNEFLYGSFFNGASIIEKFISGILLTDETFGVAVQKPIKKMNYRFGGCLAWNVSAYINWVISNIFGAIFCKFYPIFIFTETWF
ncbi:hypothetical protein CHE29_10210 [Salmonella enterica]|nr:hypothetical protein CHE29_10210 [Salmonella enterica]